MQLTFTPNTTTWLLCAALLSIIWLPNLLTKGMFMDGVINALVAENLANGLGSFYHLKDYNYPENDYNGHPPLAFLLQAFFFKLTGSAHYMERIYSLLCLLVQVGLLTSIWKNINIKNYAYCDALPVVFFVLCPVAIFSYSNNLLENTMSIFTTASVWWVCLSITGRSRRQFCALMSGFMLTAALLCKGPVALFVLAAPLLFWRERTTGVYYTALMLITALLVGLILYLIDKDFGWMLERYYREQLSRVFHLAGEKWWIRFRIWAYLLINLLPMLLVWGIFYWQGNRGMGPKDVAFRFIALGLAGSVPLAIGHKQSAFYLLPAMPFMAMGFSLLSADGIEKFMQRLSATQQHVIVFLSAVLIMVALSLCVLNKDRVKRDHDLINDAAEIARNVNGKYANAGWDLDEEWHFRAYLYRYHKVAVCMPANSCNTLYYIHKRAVSPVNGMKRIYSGNRFDLYKSN
ncbi:MAG: glycosyltransferase family 39 protein [Chitinophagales bacterium]|nr:glycosyltransferase family 39 protein [Chitinophagales bacterium]MDW8418496.1 glycosyltransferase family 39 protein [Chitinophagales bacterium]